MMTNAISNAKKRLLVELGKHLGPEGFPARPSGYSFRKRTEFGNVAIHLNIAQYEDEFSAAVHVSIRFDAVENLVNACANSALLTEAIKKRSATLGCELGNLKEARRREWRVVESSDISRIASEMAAFIREWGLAYFKTYSSMETAYGVLGANRPQAAASGGFESIAERAVALAYVIGGAPEAGRMIEVKREQMNALDPRHRALFEQFVSCFKRQTGMV
jgi:hypothetical protein